MDSVGLGWQLRLYIFDRFPGDTDAAALRTTELDYSSASMSTCLEALQESILLSNMEPRSARQSKCGDMFYDRVTTQK